MNVVPQRLRRRPPCRPHPRPPAWLLSGPPCGKQLSCELAFGSSQWEQCHPQVWLALAHGRTHPARPPLSPAVSGSRGPWWGHGGHKESTLGPGLLLLLAPCPLDCNGVGVEPWLVFQKDPWAATQAEGRQPHSLGRQPLPLTKGGPRSQTLGEAAPGSGPQSVQLTVSLGWRLGSPVPSAAGGGRRPTGPGSAVVWESRGEAVWGRVSP